MKKIHMMILIAAFSMGLFSGCNNANGENISVIDENLKIEYIEALSENVFEENILQEIEESEASTYATDGIISVEFLAEIVEIEEDTFVICDTDGNVYEIEALNSLTKPGLEQYTVGSILKISYEVDCSDGKYEIVSDAEVTLVEGEEADEIRNILIEKGFVEVEFVYEDVLAYYERMYEGIINILKHSPEELTDAVEIAWNTDDSSDEWEMVAQMEQENLQAYIDYLFNSFGSEYNLGSSASTAQNNSTDSSSAAQSQKEDFTYFNNVTVEGVVQLTNEYRNSLGVASLAVDEKLQQAAQIRAEELAAYGGIVVNGVAHVRVDGSSWTSVLDEVGWGQGYGYRAYGENCTMFMVSTSNPAESSTLVNNWINSEPHRLAMISSDYTLIGVGIAWNGSTCFGVQLFGDLQ